MYLVKNSSNWVTRSAIAILFICFSFIAAHSSLSCSTEVKSIVLNFDLTEEQKSSDAEKDFNEDPTNLFFLDFQKFKALKNTIKIVEAPTVLIIPRVFYEIQLLPPEV